MLLILNRKELLIRTLNQGAEEPFIQSSAGGLAIIEPEDSRMLWKLFQLQNLERLWIPSRGQNFIHKLQERGDSQLRPVGLRVYRNGRFH